MNPRSVIETVIKLLPAQDRSQLGAELNSHLTDAALAGDAPTAGDVLSLAALVGRRWTVVGFQNLPYLFLGLPIAFVAFLPFILVYEAHFPAWDLMEDAPSSRPLARVLRSWLVGATIAALCLVAGARAVIRVRAGSYLLPATLCIVGLVMMTQSDLFTERLPWYTSSGLNLKPAHADFVSPYSLYMVVLTAMVPLGFLLIDTFGKRRSGTGAGAPELHKWMTQPGGQATIVLGVAVAIWAFRPTLLLVVPLTIAASGRLSRRATIVVLLCMVAFCVWIGVVALIDD